LNLDASDFTNNLDEVILDSNYDCEEDNDNEESNMRADIQDNDFEEEEWDPEREVDDILDEKY